jgi:cell division protein FtsB
MNVARWLTLAGFAGAVVFAVGGGEYGTFDYFELKGQVGDMEAELAELRHTVDSLDRVALALEKDPKVQERVAREQFGMLRSGEFLYRLVPAEESASAP